MPAKTEPKKESIEELKQQLSSLQEKIAEYENPVPYSKVTIKEIYSWKSPERLFIPRNKKWLTYVILLVLVLTLVLLFLQQFIVIAPVLAIAFVAYVLASVPPQTIEHTITTQGLNTDNHSYLWDEFSDFWFTKRHGEVLLHINTYLNFPRQLILLIGEGDKDKIKDLMVQFIPYRELPKLTLIDRIADYLSDKFHKIAN